MPSCVAAARARLAALGAGALLLSSGCRSDELQDPGQIAHIPDLPEVNVVPTSGLVGEWKLDETGAATIANDSKNNFDATVFGQAGFVAGKIGNAINLNNGSAGTGGKYAEMPSNGTLDIVQEGNYTISAWFNPISVPPDGSAANHHWAIVVKAGFHMGLVYQQDQKFSMRHYLTGDVLKTANSSGTYAPNGWRHLAGVVNKTAGTITLYVDGASVGSATFTAGTAARDFGTTRFRIGKAASNWAADGKVDQVRIYNRALSAAEVGELFRETPGALGISFGLSGLRPDSSFTDSRWTGGVKFVASMPIVLDQLQAAQAKSPKLRMWYNIVSGNEQDFFTSSTDHSFSVSKWKATLDNNVRGSGFLADGSSPWHDDFQPFIQDGTFQGTLLLDDAQNFDPDPTFDQIEAIAAHMKLRFPTLLTAMRVEPSWLESRAAGRTYTKVDAGWAQYRENKLGLQAAAYRDQEIAAAERLNLGLVLGINITKGKGPFTGPETGTDVPPDLLRSWGNALLAAGASDYGCSFMMWDVRYAFLNDPVMTELSDLAKNHVAAPCKRH